jgi:nucleoid-associated protein YgaU
MLAIPSVTPALSRAAVPDAVESGAFPSTAEVATERDSLTQGYRVKEGDNFWSIADEFYGDARLWSVIYEANKDRMIDPERPLLMPGMILMIPHVFAH